MDDDTLPTESDTATDRTADTTWEWPDPHWDRFYTKAFGIGADEAFHKAVGSVRWRCDAFSPGTIWEKENRGFIVIPEHEHEETWKQQYARQLIENGDERVANIESPAGAINLSGTEQAREYRERYDHEDDHGAVWLFFGVTTEPSETSPVGGHSNHDENG